MSVDPAFYMDANNCGNYSLKKIAVPTRQLVGTVAVPVRKAADEAANWRRQRLSIFYKSDTRGHDEIIVTNIDQKFWDAVFIGTIEFWRIEKPAWPVGKFRVVLDKFPNKIFKGPPGMALSTGQVLVFACGSDGSDADIVF